MGPGETSAPTGPGTELHQLANDLALALGSQEVAIDEPRLPPHLRTWLAAASDGVASSSVTTVPCAGRGPGLA